MHQYAYWDGKTRRRKSSHPAVFAFAQPKIDLVSKVIQFNGDMLENMTVLEAGCGSGHMSLLTKQHSRLLVASDYSMNMLTQNPVDTKLCCNASTFPFQDNCFDCVLCTNLLHHADNPSSIVREMLRVSKKYLIIIEPNRNNPIMFLYGLFSRNDHGLLKMSLTWLHSLSSALGIVEVFFASQGLVLPNITPTPLVKYLKKAEKWLKPHFYIMAVWKK
jgi:SAM-dependent methyltransferase